MSSETEKPPLTLMVSSTVYGIEELLEKIYATLTAFGYEVWMSHKGTLPVSSTRTAFENCLHGVEQCDLFLSLITPQYGSGVPGKGEMSITHQELIKAIELNKPRWILAHSDVVFARTLLMNLGHDTAEKRASVDGAVCVDLPGSMEAHEIETLTRAREIGVRIMRQHLCCDGIDLAGSYAGSLRVRRNRAEARDAGT